MAWHSAGGLAGATAGALRFAGSGGLPNVQAQAMESSTDCVGSASSVNGRARDLLCIVILLVTAFDRYRSFIVVVCFVISIALVSSILHLINLLLVVLVTDISFCGGGGSRAPPTAHPAQSPAPCLRLPDPGRFGRNILFVLLLLLEGLAMLSPELQ